MGKRGTAEAPQKYVKGGSKKTHGKGQAGVGPPGITGSGPKQSSGPKKRV